MAEATGRGRETDGGEVGGLSARLAERSTLSFAAEESAGLVLAAQDLLRNCRFIWSE